MLFGEEDDDNDFAPSPNASSKLSALFGGPTSRSSSLKYVAPKQPRSDSTGEKNGSSPAGQQTPGQPQAPVVLLATAVHAYLYVNDVAQTQGRAMCCVLGSIPERNFQLLVYRSKQDHLTRARIQQYFNFKVLPNNYASFSDDQQRTWSIMIDTGQYVDFVTQVGICRAMSTLTGNSGQYLMQDIVSGDGPTLKEGDHAQISYSKWNIANGKKSEQVEESKSGHRVKLKEGSSNWEQKLLGMQKNSRRLVFMSSGKDNTSVIFYDVIVERVKQKGGGDQSGRSTPQVELQHHHQDMSSSNRSLNMLPEDTESSIDNESAPRSKAAIVSRMARMGHALLPSGLVNSRHPPTDSESEVEEITRRRKQKYTSGSVSGSVEELEATPALRSRVPSHSDSLKSESAPHTSHSAHQPQQLVVYQSPWQQPALLPPGYTAVQPGVQSVVNTSQPPAAADPTMSLLFSETRSQNTELKISVSKVSDKIDGLASKIEKMEQQLRQQEGINSHSALVPASVVNSQFNLLHQKSAVDAQAILAQITTLVTENDTMKAVLEEKDKKITLLNESLTQLLQKNQKLLEEKTDMLIAKQDSGKTVSLTEVLELREEKASISSELGNTRDQLTAAKEEALEFRRLFEKQEVELKSLKIQVQEEQTRSKDLERVSNSYKEKERELNQMLQEAESEKQRLQSVLDENESTKIELQKESCNLNSKLLELEKRLHTAINERDNLDERLRTTLQQMEERTRGDGESSTEKEIENQLREDIMIKTSKISQLEKDLAEQQAQNVETIQDLKQEASKCKAHIQKLEGEKKALENSNGNIKSSSNSEDIVATVKKVMNTVFKTLKPQFTEEGSYSGAVVTQTLLTVIRDTTLQLLEDIDKSSSAEEKSPESETTSSVPERGNGVCNVGNVQAVHGPKLSEIISGSSYNSVDNANPVESKSDRDWEQTVHLDNSDKVIHKEKLKDIGGEVDRDCIPESDYNREAETEDLENRTDFSSSEGEYTDASDRQFSPKNSVSSSDSVSYDCEKSVNTVSLDSDTEKNVSAGLSQKISEVGRAPSPQTIQSVALRTPVIDMQSTEVGTEPNEKSDSSRDSSLDRAWRPQPPPPPLFSDEDDDDDWLS
ncbi:FK506-binding protein 15-like isoform X2 [Palaemon carinicauda]|uniref:FK506-binding protein 15-like isoform X2 n=1 Tax=Palaemon carinicauda TaxID=392227 RepID=UPI0035B5FC30